MTVPQDFLGRQVLVSGAAHGIGAATAVLLRARGAHVTGLDIADPGGHCDAWLRVDLADCSAIDALALEGPFHALVNAAGLPPHAGAEAALLAVNYFGTVALTERVIPHLAPGGAIASMASRAGTRWRENVAQIRRLATLGPKDDLDRFIASERISPARAYDLSKEALIWWTKSATARLIDLGLRGNTVSPAAVETRILGDFVAAFGARAERGMALTRRAGKADEIAEVLAFLVSPASGWLKGANIEADGGLTAQLEILALRA